MNPEKVNPNFDVEYWDISEPQPYENNPRVISDEAIEKVAASIDQFGWRQPIVVDADGIIVIGHTRLKAAQSLGLKQVPVHVAKNLSGDQIKALRLADNRTGEFSEWDEEKLAQELADLENAIDLDFDLHVVGWDEDEIGDLIAGDASDEDLDQANEEVAPPENPVAREGDLWILGDHRLACGDSTDKKHVERLLDGAKPHLMVTDPPYGVEYDAEWRLLRAEAVAVDSGNWTQKVYEFARSAQAMFKPRYAIKGVDGQGRPIWTRSEMRIKGGGKLYIVGVDDAKTEIYGQLAKQEAGPGYVHFAGHLDLDWFKQLVVERILIVYKSNVAKRVWDCPRGKRNEALDCLVYATAARYSMEIDFIARRHYLTQKIDDQPTLADLAGVFS